MGSGPFAGPFADAGIAGSSYNTSSILEGGSAG